MKYCPVCKTKYDDGVSFCPVDGEVLEDDPSSIVNTVLDGQYQIEALLGKGGMGAVFLARHILLGDRVAIKVLPPEMRNNAEWLRRFRREGQAARRFRHPNAVTVYDLRTAGDGTIYMVMEYVEGHTLDAEMKARGRFTPGEAVAALEPIMSVLNAAHAMGVVHRDLKPENIMIGKATTGGEPTVKLLDLGIAKLREVAGADGGGTTALTMAGQMLGTPYYMSPEQWGELPSDGSSEIDGRADIYSLGLVFYEMIAGRKPYSAMTLLELRKEHVTATPRRLDQVNPDVPHAFSDVIARAMAKDRGDRPGTAGEFLAELKAALGSTEPRFSPVSDVPKGMTTQPEAPTVTVGKVSPTISDVDAPTILTMDESPNVVRPPAPDKRDTVAILRPEEVGASAQTVAESASSITAPQAARIEEPPSSSTVAQPLLPQRVPRSRRGATAAVAGGVVLLVLIVAGVGGFFLVNSMRAKTSNDNHPSNSSLETKAPSPAPAPAKEVARYWLEVTSGSRGAKPAQVVPMIPIASGQLFKFHFTSSEDGYLYIVGPGEQNKPTAFLTAKPAVAASGLSSNEVKKGVDFSFPTGSFPNGEERWLGLDKNPGTESYTLIFSTIRLESPLFLNGEATGHPLSEMEQTDLTTFLAKYKTNSPETEYNNSNSATPFVVAKAPSPIGSGNPLILEVRIQHR
jgi:serine/threonine protein kinase